jgi:sugar phosphate isomerase/epimerase
MLTTMDIKYLSTYWGQSPLTAEAFISKWKESGYDGMEIDLPENPSFIDELNGHIATREIRFPVVAQMVLPPKMETPAENISRTLKRLNEVISLHPLFINSQTGKDFYSFDDNCRIIEAVMNFGHQHGVPIFHETHRGKFSFHLATLLPYLKRFPEMQLTGDFSHFCVVSESLLEDQANLLEQLIPHISHIHARVGFSQSPQVNDPMAPEWESTLTTHLDWWQKIVDHHLQAGTKLLTITPEFGPAPYMPALPFTQQPIGNQWKINMDIMNYLKSNLKNK